MSTGDGGRRDRTLRLQATERELHGRPGDAVVFRLLLTNGLRDSEVFTYSVEALEGEFDGDLRAPVVPVGSGETAAIELEIQVPEDGAPGRYTIRIAALLERDETIGVAQDLALIVEEPEPVAPPVFVPPVVPDPPRRVPPVYVPPVVEAPRPPTEPEAVRPRRAAPFPAAAGERRPPAFPAMSDRRSSPVLLVAGLIGVATIGLIGIFLLTQIGGGNDEGGIVQGASTTPSPSVSLGASSSPTASVTRTPGPTQTTAPITETDTPTPEVTEEPEETPDPGNSAPIVLITSPGNGQVFCPGPPGGQGAYTADITLLGNVSDDEDGVLPNDAISWSYDLNGQGMQFLANSDTVTLAITATADTFKTVEILLEATDSDGESSESSVTVSVGGPQAAACLGAPATATVTAAPTASPTVPTPTP